MTEPNFEQLYQEYLKYHASAPNLRLVTFYEFKLLELARANRDKKKREFMRILDYARLRAGI